MGKNHLVITGTGRAGTTFLVQLLGALGLETGFQADASVDSVCHAGLETNPLCDPCPYVIKSPNLCDWLSTWIERDRPIIDHAIVPMRDLFSAAESRRDVNRRAGAGPHDYVAGGCWDGADQESVLRRKFYSLVSTLAEHDIPITLLWFPRLATDATYLFCKLKGLPRMDKIEAHEFVRAFDRVSRPELIHRFT